MASTEKLGGERQLPPWPRGVPPPPPREGPRLQQESKKMHRSYSLGSVNNAPDEINNVPGNTPTNNNPAPRPPPRPPMQRRINNNLPFASPPSPRRQDKNGHRNTAANGRALGGTPKKFSHRLLLSFIFLVVMQLLVTQTLDLSQYLASSTIDNNMMPVLPRFIPTPLSNITLHHLTQLEKEVTKIHNQKAISCKTPQGRSLCEGDATLVWYNPSNRDKFICNDILLGPGKTKMLKAGEAKMDDCWDNAWKMSLTSHSFPMEATLANKGLFPGISIKNGQTKPIDDTFSANLEHLTFPINDPGQKHNLYTKNESHGLVFSVQKGSGKAFMGEFGAPLRCDIKCEFVPKMGLNGAQWVHGTDWKFEYSIEGSHYYTNLKIGDFDWKNNIFFATTSFKSEVPASYFSLDKNWWGDTLQTPAVDYTKAIKGASFLARNCNAKNNRNSVVKDLIEAGFRVDSLSSCLKNADVPPDVNLQNKTNVMEKYLFHLAFENGRVDDYITEKLWMAFHSGTLPVVLGPANIKDHIDSFRGVIYVDDYPTVQDLANYLNRVANNQTLYESYHAWRKEPYTDKFIEKYNFTHVHPTCRMCRWAFAKKYGLGWSHSKQTIKQVTLSRNTCVESSALKNPLIESWWDGSNPSSRRKLSIRSTDADKELCPITNSTIVTSKIGDGQLARSLWSHDGTTDMYLEGKSTIPLVLMLQLPIMPKSKHVHGDTVWFEDEQSRISLVFKSEGLGSLDLNSALKMTTSFDTLDMTINPDNIPIRIRIIVEDRDALHKGAAEEQTYFGKIMTDDVEAMPELFTLDSMS